MSNMEKLITQAAKLLGNGGIVSLPTETVYSLSANAYNDIAVEKIYKLKGRKQNNPLSLLVGSIRDADEIVSFNKHAEILMEAFFPGSLTLVLPRRKNTKISKLVNEDLNTLAVRMPNHATTLAVLNAVNFSVVGTSANPSGLLPATNADSVEKYFSKTVDMIIDGGSCDVGIASTILDLSRDLPIIIRKGSISALQIKEKLGFMVKIVE